MLTQSLSVRAGPHPLHSTPPHPTPPPLNSTPPHPAQLHPNLYQFNPAHSTHSLTARNTDILKHPRIILVSPDQDFCNTAECLHQEVLISLCHHRIPQQNVVLVSGQGGLLLHVCRTSKELTSAYTHPHAHTQKLLHPAHFNCSNEWAFFGFHTTSFHQFFCRCQIDIVLALPHLPRP